MYQAISKHNAAPQSGVQPNLDWSVKQGFVVGISTKYNPTYAAPPPTLHPWLQLWMEAKDKKDKKWRKRKIWADFFDECQEMIKERERRQVQNV